MKDRFEKDIKHIFNQHEEAVDQDALWAGIEEGITPKKDRRFIWFLAPIFLLAFAVWGYVLWPVNKGLPSYSEEVQSFTGNSDNIKVEEIQTTLNVGADNEKIDEETVSSDNFASENLALGKTKLSIDLANTTNSKTIAIENNFSVANNETLVNENFEYLNENAVNSFVEKALIKHSSKMDKEEIKQGSAGQQSALSFIGEVETLLEKQQTIQSNTRKILFQDAYLAMHSQLIDYAIESLPNSMKLNQVTNAKDPNLSKPKKKNSINSQKLGVLLYGSLGFGVKNYKASADYGQISKAMEQIQAGISFGAFSYKDFTFITGLQYTMLTDEFAWSGEYNGSEVATYLQEVTYYENEEVIMSFVEEPVETTITREILLFPKRQILSIPLSINYTFPIAKKRMSLVASYLLSYQLPTKEFLFNSKGVPGKYDIDGSWFNPNFELGLAYRYPLGEKLSLTLSPYYNFTNYKLQKFDLFSEHLNHHFGIKFGIGF